MVKYWKHSRLRYYILNTIWNYSFWLHAKPLYKYFHYEVELGMDLEKTFSDHVMKVQTKKEKRTQKRFIGLLYKGMIYQDNPGIQGIEKEVWDKWIEKRLIKL